MKKVLFFLMAMVAITITSCKHDTCTLNITNHYSKSVLVLISNDEKCSDPAEAEIAVHCKTMTAWNKSGVKLDGLYAIVYVCQEEEIGEEFDREAYKRMPEINLGKYAGMATVTIDVKADGYPRESASSM